MSSWSSLRSWNAKNEKNSRTDDRHLSTRLPRLEGRRVVICESTEQIVAHHVDGDRGNNTIENLEPVCQSCHGKIHTGADGFEEWFEALHPDARIYDDPSVREKTHVAMYFDQELADDLDLRFDELNLEYRREHGEKMTKNGDFYPALVRSVVNDTTVRKELGLDSE
ncbi:HNH endonuclease signature motif containing protein [Halopelagius inordinatus]|uniref:HNH endonuclease signature motif containing protein n=1 Tax=Halopelagius inordinatus TaxID=553467 RepID=UPI001160B0EB|nr:HNH endonuclease signature motif containing protein [Halopelagius inordinatus]